MADKRDNGDLVTADANISKGTPLRRSTRLNSASTPATQPEGAPSTPKTKASEETVAVRRSRRLSQSKVTTPEDKPIKKVLTRRASANEVSTPKRQNQKTSERDSPHATRSLPRNRRCVSESPTNKRLSFDQSPEVEVVTTRRSNRLGTGRSTTPVKQLYISKIRNNLASVSEDPSELTEVNSAGATVDLEDPEEVLSICNSSKNTDEKSQICNEVTQHDRVKSQDIYVHKAFSNDSELHKGNVKTKDNSDQLASAEEALDVGEKSKEVVEEPQKNTQEHLDTYGERVPLNENIVTTAKSLFNGILAAKDNQVLQDVNIQKSTSKISSQELNGEVSKVITDDRKDCQSSTREDSPKENYNVEKPHVYSPSSSQKNLKSRDTQNQTVALNGNIATAKELINGLAIVKDNQAPQEINTETSTAKISSQELNSEVSKLNTDSKIDCQPSIREVSPNEDPKAEMPHVSYSPSSPQKNSKDGISNILSVTNCKKVHNEHMNESCDDSDSEELHLRLVECSNSLEDSQANVSPKIQSSVKSIQNSTNILVQKSDISYGQPEATHIGNGCNIADNLDDDNNRNTDDEKENDSLCTNLNQNRAKSRGETMAENCYAGGISLQNMDSKNQKDNQGCGLSIKCLSNSEISEESNTKCTTPISIAKKIAGSFAMNVVKSSPSAPNSRDHRAPDVAGACQVSNGNVSLNGDMDCESEHDITDNKHESSPTVIDSPLEKANSTRNSSQPHIGSTDNDEDDIFSEGSLSDTSDANHSPVVSKTTRAKDDHTALKGENQEDDILPKHPDILPSSTQKNNNHPNQIMEEQQRTNKGDESFASSGDSYSTNRENLGSGSPVKPSDLTEPLDPNQSLENENHRQPHQAISPSDCVQKSPKQSIKNHQTVKKQNLGQLRTLSQTDGNHSTSRSDVEISTQCPNKSPGQLRTLSKNEGNDSTSGSDVEISKQCPNKSPGLLRTLSQTEDNECTLGSDLETSKQCPNKSLGQLTTFTQTEGNDSTSGSDVEISKQSPNKSLGLLRTLSQTEENESTLGSDLETSKQCPNKSLGQLTTFTQTEGNDSTSGSDVEISKQSPNKSLGLLRTLSQTDENDSTSRSDVETSKQCPNKSQLRNFSQTGENDSLSGSDVEISKQCPKKSPGLLITLSQTKGNDSTLGSDVETSKQCPNRKSLQMTKQNGKLESNFNNSNIKSPKLEQEKHDGTLTSDDSPKEVIVAMMTPNRNPNPSRRTIKTPKEVLEKIDLHVAEYVRRQENEKHKNAEDVTSCDSEDCEADNEESGRSALFIDEMADEGEESSPADDSNEIPDEGESVGYSSSNDLDPDDSYERNSFIDDEEEVELLSGSEYASDVGREPKHKSSKRDEVVPPNSNKRWSRIVTVDSSSEEEATDTESTSIQSVKKSESSSCKMSQTDTGPIEVLDASLTVTPQRAFIAVSPSSDKKSSIIVNVDSSSEEEDIDSESTGGTSLNVHASSSSQDEEQSVGGRNQNSSCEMSRIDAAFVERVDVSLRSTPQEPKRASITVKENISIDDIKDDSLRAKINDVVEMFCKRNYSQGEYSLNVSLDYTPADRTEESAQQQQTSGSSRTGKKKRRHRKRKAKHSKVDELSQQKELDSSFLSDDVIDAPQTNKRQKMSEEEIMASSSSYLQQSNKKCQTEFSEKNVKKFRSKPIPEHLSLINQKQRKQEKIQTSTRNHLLNIPNERSWKDTGKRDQFPAFVSLNATENKREKRKIVSADKTYYDITVPANKTYDIVAGPKRKRRKISVSKSNNDPTWTTEVVTIKPSESSNQLVNQPATKTFTLEAFHPKDFRNRMLFDPKRVQRVDMSTVLRKK